MVSASSLQPSALLVQTVRKNLEERKFLLMKIFGVTTLLFSLVYNSIDNYMLTEEETTCITDKTVNLTKPINNFLANHEYIKKMLIIYSSLLLDSVLVSTLYIFIFRAKNYRLFITFVLFYSVKAILHSVFAMQAPSDLLWEYPGVYSLTFSHFHESDFFYSGQIGMSTISFLEFRKRNIKFLKFLAFNCLLTQIGATLVLRTNYIIDIVGGFVFAHYFFMICQHLMPDESEVKKKEEEEEVMSNGSSGSRCCCQCKD